MMDQLKSKSITKIWLFFLLLCIIKASSADEHHKVIIVGAGSAGIAAASKLLQNGIDDLQILEAEGRIGGRVHSVELGDYMVDLGAQYVYGSDENAIYGMAEPLNLLSYLAGEVSPFFKIAFEQILQHVKPEVTTMADFLGDGSEYFGSSRLLMTASRYSSIMQKELRNITSSWSGVDGLLIGSTGEYLDQEFEYIFYQKNIPDWLQEPILRSIRLAHMTKNGADDLYKVSAKGERDHQIAYRRLSNWKNKTFSTMFDVLTKKYPNPDEELPTMKKIQFNKKISKINFGGDGPLVLTTADGNKYSADYLIFTPSLGVLKAHYQDIFEPDLPHEKINSIRNLGMGQSAKIYVHYDSAWWKKDSVFNKVILWSNSDAKILANDTQRSWMLSVYALNEVEWRPHTLVLLLSGSYIKNMEILPEDVVKTQTVWLIKKFLTPRYNVTEPIGFTRSTWSTNENFLGSNSYRSLRSDKFNASAEDLAKPVMNGDKPRLLFAGEATSDKYGSVHGAVVSGWREADRIIAYEKKQ